MRSLLLAVPCLCVLGVVAAAEPPRLTLDQVMAKALVGPQAQMAAGDIDAAAAHVGEAKAAGLPKGTLTAFGTLSPRITCDNFDCTQTSPRNFAFRFSGLYGSAQLTVTQPLYTFGKLSHGRKATEAGLAAQRSLADETAGDLALEAARAYWGVKLSRELGAMLDDGIDQIEQAIARMEDHKGDKTVHGDGEEVTIQDRQRVVVLLAEAKAERTDATAGELQALAGLRALTGIRDADIDNTEFVALEKELPKTANGDRRPQALAAKAGAVAADELAAFNKSFYWPDFAVVASGIVSGAQGVDLPPSAFAWDPYHRIGAGAVVALQWQIEPFTVKARVERTRAEARKAHAQSDLAALGASYEAQTALSEATGAREKVAAAAGGEKAARTWLASVLQADAIGAAEPRDLADAYLAWFQMRGRWAQAVFQWNVAVVRLGRASGEFRAKVSRP
jgi:outer membrane protein